MSIATYMTWVADHRDIWTLTHEFYGKLPLWAIAVYLLTGIRKSSVDSTKLLNAHSFEPLHSSQPECKIWVDRIFHEHRDIYTS